MKQSDSKGLFVVYTNQKTQRDPSFIYILYKSQT